MPSGYDVSGTDLDSILAPLHSGWPQAGAVGYEVAGADLNARYAPLSTGSAPAATGYKKATADLNTIFAANGSTGVQVGTQPSNVSGTLAAGNPSGVVTSGSTTCAGSKGGGTYTYTWHTSGCTALSPSSPTTTFDATVNAGTTDNATAFCTISDGVTSVNTTTISVTLQNTTPAFSPTLVIISTVGLSTQIVPAGATNVVVEAIAPSAWGGLGFGGAGHEEGGGGGGAGALSRSSFACSGGETLSANVGAAGTGPSSPGVAGTTTVSSGTLVIPTMTALGGHPGNPGVFGSPGAGGLSGSASGGNLANISGGLAGAGGPGIGGSGAPGVVGLHATGPNGGNGGDDATGAGQTSGGNGLVALFYT